MDKINNSFHINGVLYSDISYAIAMHDWNKAVNLINNNYSLRVPGTFPLMELTCWSDYTLEQIKFLLDNGADPNETNIDGFTPFSNLSYDNNFDCANLLFLAGCDINKKGVRGANAVFQCVASDKFNPHYLAWLLEIGCEYQFKDRDEMTIATYSMFNPLTKSYAKLINDAVNGTVSKEVLINNLRQRNEKDFTLKDRIHSKYITFKDYIEYCFKNEKKISSIDSYPEGSIAESDMLMASKLYKKSPLVSMDYMLRAYARSGFSKDLLKLLVQILLEFDLNEDASIVCKYM